MNINFEIGKQIKNLLQEVVGEKSKVETRKFQPSLNDYHTKNILRFGLLSSKKMLIEKNIITEREAEDLSEKLKELADDPNVVINYMKNTASLR